MDPSAQSVTKAAVTPTGTRDGSGAADRDVPYTFGHRPTSSWTCPFSWHQYARLLVLRGRVQDGEFAADLAQR
jgi:hypothetical protein